MRSSGPAPWAVAASITVAFGVGVSVVLISVSQGVSDNLPNLAAGAPQDRLDHIHTMLNLLTVVVTSAVLIQTAAAIYVLGVTTMRSRREEIALRRQSGVLKSRLLYEFARGMFGACLTGALAGEVIGIGVASLLQTNTALPVSFTPVSLLSAFPVTVVLAILATLGPAWRGAGASPALLRRGA